MFILRRGTEFLASYAAPTLGLIVVLGMIRLLIPVDFDSAVVIRSDVIIPGIIDILNYRLLGLPVEVWHILAAIWAYGTCVRGKSIIMQHIESVMNIMSLSYVDNSQAVRVASRLKCNYEIRVSPELNIAFTAGVLKPVIYIPAIDFSDEQMYYILCHELTHIRSHDSLKSLLFLVIEAVFWWNPLSHISLDEIDNILELQCDSRVADRIDEDQLQEYLDTILYVIKNAVDGKVNAPGRMAHAITRDFDVKQRFELLNRRNERKPKHIRYALCACIVSVFILSYFVIVQVYYPQGGFANEINTSSECYIMTDGEEYYLCIGESTIVELPEEQLNSAPFNEYEIRGEQ